MDVSDASYYISNEKKKNKGSQMGHTRKYILKNQSTNILVYGKYDKLNDLIIVFVRF
jgi:hypothetical protein